MIQLSIVITIVVTSILTNSQQDTRTYRVARIDKDLALSGRGDDPRWQKAEALTDFHYPWEKERPHPTVFRALHNSDWFYCLFEVEDPNVIIYEGSGGKSDVASSSRAEIFFRIDDKLAPYYCLEIDPTGKVLDYEAHYHRKFNVRWSWPADQLVIRTDRNPKGYTVEVAISKKSLQDLGLLKESVLQAGIFRADCLRIKDGQADFKWISWLRPDSATPDFHIPSSFGTLRLED